MKYFLFTFFLLAVIKPQMTAQDTQYFFLEDVFQRSYLNPALINTQRFTVASGLAAHFGTDGPVYNDLFSKNSSGIPVLNIENGISKMHTLNNIFGGVSIHTLDIGFKLKNINIAVGHAWKLKGFLQYSKDLAEIGAYGNAQYIGETKSLGPSYEYINYNEVYMSLQKKIGLINVGLRIKNLSGEQTIQTIENKINLTTEEEIYAIQIESDYTVNSSGTLEYFRVDSLDISAKAFSIDNIFKANNGWAFDIGASIDLNKKMELSFGANDLGSITWDKDAKSLRANGDNTYTGIDLSSYIGTDEDILVEDSIRALLEFEETEGEFTSSLPSQYYLGGRYKLNDIWTLGGLFVSSNFTKKSRYTLVVNTTAKWKLWSIGFQYTANSENATNIGINGGIYIGPVVIFATIENILALPNKQNSNYNAMRLGLSLNL